jgi:hypothetical protein
MKANMLKKVFTTLWQTLPFKTETRLRLEIRRQAITVLETPLKWPSSTTSRQRAQSSQTLRTRSNTEITWMPTSRSSLSMQALGTTRAEVCSVNRKASAHRHQ